MARKTISPPTTAMVNQVATNPVAWFIVLMLAVVAPLLRPTRSVRDTHAIAATPVSEPVPEPPPPKVFIDITPGYLIDLYKDRTSIQGDVLAAAYMGKWIVVTGKVRDIYVTGDALTAQVYDNDEQFIVARFSKEGSEKLSKIARGATVKVRGEIFEIDIMRLRLRECDLDQIDPN